MPQPDAKSDDPTRTWTPPQSPLPENFAPQKQNIEGSGSELAEETRELLHRRLRAASLMLAMGFGVFLLRDFWLPKVLLELYYLHCVVFSLLVLNVLALSGRWKPSMNQLRALELVTFAVVASFFIGSQCIGMQAQRPARHAHQLGCSRAIQDQHHRHADRDLHIRDLHPQHLAQSGAGHRPHVAGDIGCAPFYWGWFLPCFALSPRRRARSIS